MYKKIAITITVLLILAIVVILIFQKSRTMNFEDIVSMNVEKTAEIEVIEYTSVNNPKRVSLNKKEEIEVFLNEFSDLKLKEDKNIIPANAQYIVLIMPNKVHLDYTITVYDNKHISIHQYGQKHEVHYEIVNDGEVNLEELFNR